MARHSIVVTLASLSYRIQEISGLEGMIRRFIGYTPKTYELAKKEALALCAEHGLLSGLQIIMAMDPKEASPVQQIMGARFGVQIVKCTDVAAKILPIKHRVKVTGFTKEVMDELERELESLIHQNATKQMEAYGLLEKFGFRSFRFDNDGNLVAVTHHPVWGESWTEAVN